MTDKTMTKKTSNQNMTGTANNENKGSKIRLTR